MAAPQQVDPIVLPPDGHTIPVTSADGTLIHTTVFGPDDAPTVVLIHGFSQQGRMWAYQVRDLVDDTRVVVYDHRGHGRSGWAQSYTIDDLGDDLHAVLAAVLRPGEKAVLAGHSMGGITIMSWAQRHPADFAARAAAVLMVNSAPSEIGVHVAVIGVPRRLHRYSRYIIRKRLLTIVQTRARRPLRYLAFGETAHPRHVDAVVEMLREAPQRTLREFIASLLFTDLTSALPALTCPTVIIAGGRDRLLPPVHNTRMAAGLPNVERVIMQPSSGHMGPWEERDAVSTALRDAVDAHLDRPRP